MKQKLPLLLGAAIVAAFLAWGIWEAYRPAPQLLQGQIEAREIDVAAKVAGRISRVHVKEGDSVQAGAALFDLDSPEISAKLSQVSAVKEAAESVSAKAQNGARAEEILMAKLNWQRAQTGAELADTSARRVDNLFKEGLMAQQKRDEAMAQAKSARDLAAAAKAQYDMAQHGARREDKAAAAAQVKQAGGAVAEVEAYQAETRIKAPAAGEVVKVLVDPGELTPTGFPVVTLVDLSDTWAVFAVREDQLARFQKDAQFNATVPALHKQVAFKVSHLSPMGEFATWKAVRGSKGYDLRTFEVKARPLQPTPGLRPGMSVVIDRS